jgi:hypothetical protein
MQMPLGTEACFTHKIFMELNITAPPAEWFKYNFGPLRIYKRTHIHVYAQLSVVTKDSLSFNSKVLPG